MKILYDYETMIIQNIGGVSRYHYELARHIRKQNDVDIPVLFSRNYYFEKYFKKKAWNYQNRYLKWFLRKINAVYTFGVLTKAYLSGKPYDVIHSTFYNPDYIYLYYKLIDKNHRSKFFITIYDMIQEMEASERPNMKRSARAKKKALGVADGIIAISQKTKDDLLEYYPFVQEDRIKVIYLSSNKTSEKQPQNNNKRIFDYKYVLFVGERVERKNFRRVLEAMGKIHKDMPDLHLVCTGGGKFNEEEEQLIENAGMKGLVCQKFFDDEDLYSLYANAECFIFPSLYEGFGLPILEAWSRNCPVLLSTASCFPEIAQDAALYFDGNSTDEIEMCLRKMVESDELKNEFREKGRRRLADFSWGKMARETQQWYSEIIEK